MNFVYSLHIVTLILFSLLQASRVLATDGTEVLTIRPEKLHSNQERLFTTEIGRNPFSWPADFLSIDEAYQEEAQIELSLTKDLNLQSIFWNTDSPQAIINNEFVNIGDQIQEVFIEQIHKDHVIVSKDGFSQRLDFKIQLYDFSEKDGAKN